MRLRGIIIGMAICLCFYALVAVAVANAQDFTVINHARISTRQLSRVEGAIVRQSGRLNLAWQTGTPRFVRSGGWPIFLESSPASMKPAGGTNQAIGFHTYSWHPYIVVWTQAMPWSETLSHEVVETLVDPTTQRLIGGPTPYIGWVAEVADPVEDVTISAWGTYLSDWVLPAWFFKGSQGPWDAQRLLPGALYETMGGSAQWWDGQEYVQEDHFHPNVVRHPHPPPVTVQSYG